ncbi:CPBP family intramembrane glutamic endopeptidase [uncultured Dokdonia sp.]|uniref:CPBP family intramembrane glutamic endopeptidase n=1 Tax=uncultured Dokdonia sp. TaxID=575653 RepID=UPI0030EB659E
MRELLKNNPLKLFVLAVIFAPIIEEMMFRTLIKPSHSDIILLLCSWPLFYSNKFIPADVHWVIKLGFIAIFLFTVFTILKQLIPEQRTLKLRNFLSRHAMVVLIVSSLLFGMVHINNYVDTFALNAALIALIIPRIISGFMMGLLKIKNENIAWPMALHAMNNGFVIIILIFSKTMENS